MKAAGGLVIRACFAPQKCPAGAPEARCDGDGAVLSCHDGAIERAKCRPGTRCEEHKDESGDATASCELPGRRRCDLKGARHCEGDRLVECSTSDHFGKVRVSDCAGFGLRCTGSGPRAGCYVPADVECDKEMLPKCDDDGQSLVFCAAGRLDEDRVCEPRNGDLQPDGAWARRGLFCADEVTRLDLTRACSKLGAAWRPCRRLPRPTNRARTRRRAHAARGARPAHSPARSQSHLGVPEALLPRREPRDRRVPAARGSKKRFLEVYEEEGIEQLLFEAKIAKKDVIVGYAECAFEIVGSDNWMNQRYFSNRDMRPLYVEELAVHPELQGQGIGAFMLEQIEHLARVRGCTHLVLEVAENNENALKFYRTRNFYKLDAAIFLAKKISSEAELLPPRRSEARAAARDGRGDSQRARHAAEAQEAVE